MEVNFILQGKGGVGKSLIASLLAQYFRPQEQPLLCVDTDPVNATFSGYKAFDVETLNIMDGDDINPRTFDQLIERIMTAEAGRMIIDNGASTFVPLCSYLLQNDVASLLKEGGHTVRLHSVITGGQALPDTIEGFASLCRNIGTAPVVVWLNEYFGKPVHNGKTFEESKVYEKNKARIHSLVTIPAVKPETFGQDMHKMLTRRVTFDEADASPDFTIMERQRLRMMKRTLFTNMGKAHL
ncbi:conjugal transfer protein TraL [Magnetospirillum sp. 15-1]|uniref:nucleotide-binding protein n=1 Tax=Magnetospirillum sp. 15-1 TaxID=1979370 RepID=UPI000BBB7929|nr:conjugal transfer protein TraL [Magnetospirillum sp. 15-1]